jgi:hypothetical protein
VVTGDEDMRAGFEFVDKGDMTINGTEFINPEPLATDKRITVTIEVRRAGMTAFISGKEVSHLSTSGQGLTIDPSWEFPPGHVLGIGTKTTQIAIFRWQLLEVSGLGYPIDAEAVKAKAESDKKTTTSTEQQKITTPSPSPKPTTTSK